MTHTLLDRVNALEAWASEMEHAFQMLHSHILGLKRDLRAAEEELRDVSP